MKVVVDVPDNFMRRIQNLFKQRGNSDMSSFLLAALENQMQMEESGESEAISVVASAVASQAKRGAELERPSKRELSINLAMFQRNESYGRLQYIKDSKQLSPSDVVGATGQLWGQINRLFPIKVALRLLAFCLCNEDKQKREVDNFRDFSAEQARSLGLYLQGKWNGGDKISCLIGLPVGEDAEKSMNRYKNHFVLSQRVDGGLDGALPRLNLVNVDAEGKICFTKSGVAFVRQENPLLDSNYLSNPIGGKESIFSDAEASFLLDHIRDYLPGEFESITWLLQTIADGSDTRQGMEKKLKTKYKDWSMAVVTTQHMGLVSRSCELGLITKSKNGKEVKYQLAPLAKKAIKVK